ncbi:MAG: hypothetical protein ACR2JY_19040 [Chloroflexota bacterium]
MQTVTIFATMQPDTEGGPCVVLVERTSDFGQFVALVLGFRKDSDCVRLVWRVETAPPPPAPAAAGRPALSFVAAC